MQKSSMTVSTILEKFFLLVTFCVCFFCFATPAHALTVSGNLYTDEGTTAGSSGVTITVAVGTSSPPTLYTTTTGPGGTWTFTFASLATSTPLAVWVDASTTFRGALFTKSSSTVNNITGLKIFKDRVIVSHEDATTSTSTTLADMAFYDNDDDSDIQYNASTTTGILTVYAGNELHVLTGKSFAPSALIDARGNFKVATSSTANLASSSLMVGGNYINQGTAQIAQIQWTTRSSAEDNLWRSVTYGNGLFVAVAQSGTNRVMTSPDGITWTARSAAQANAWRSVSYGLGSGTTTPLFVAVSSDGTGNRVMTSPDGTNWTSRTSAADNSWRSITYGNGLFVAVSISGTGNRVMTSPDGTNWTSRTNIVDINWQSVTYGNGLFVAVSDNPTNNRVMTSPDGITWSSRTSVVSNYWQSVTYGNGLFVTVSYNGTGNRVMTSPGGYTRFTSTTTDQTFMGTMAGTSAFGDIYFTGTSTKTFVASSSVSANDFTVQTGATVVAPVQLSISGNYQNNGTSSNPGGKAWTARSASEANSWYSVTYGNGLFVAVSWDGTNRVMTSPDGITWTAQAAAEANPWQSVTYGNGLFVAVSDSGTNRVMTSPDGITWTPRSASEANLWVSVTYGNGLFVAISRDGTNRVMTSPDGITWTPRSASEANNWQSVTYGNGLFVALSINGTNQVMTSPDGITWTAQAASEANQWRSVIYGNGLFVAVSANGTNRVMTSPDGITWTARVASEANFWRSVTYGNGLFVAVSGDGTNRVMTSAVGTTTFNGDSSQTATGTMTGGSAFGNLEFTGTSTKTFVASSSVSANDFTVQTGATVVAPAQLSISGNYQNNGTSSNPGGKAWTARSASEANSWQSVTYGNGLFVAVSSDGTNRVMTSPDGTTWTPRSASEANSWYSVIYGNGLFVAVSQSGTNRVMTSPDGITWTAQAAAEANPWQSVTYGNGLFVAVSYSGTNRVMTSPDGITWTPRSASEANNWRSVTYGNGLFVAVAGNGTNRVMTSPDGITWTPRSAAEVNFWTSVTYGNGLFVAVSSDGTNRVMTSPDGTTWTPRSASEANNWRSVIYGNGLFVAVSQDGTNRAMTSPDSITWTARTATEANQWYSVTYGNGLFVALSTDGTNRAMTSAVGTTTLNGGSSQTATGAMTGASAFGNVVFTNTVGTTTLTTNASTSNFIIGTSTKVVAPSLLSISGNYTNSGTFIAGSGTTTFNGTSAQTVTGTMTGTSTFANLVITNTSGSGTSTLQSVSFGASASTTNTLTMLPGTSANFMASATSTFQNISLQGSAGQYVYLRSSIPGTKFNFSVPGTQQAVLYVNVKDSNACPTTISAGVTSVDAGNNLCWTFTSLSALLLSGMLYSDEGVTAITSGKTITIAVGTSTLSLHSTTSNASGVWNFSVPAGNQVADGTSILVFVDGDGSTRAALFTKASSSINSIPNLNLYQNRVIVSHEGTASTSIADMSFYDNDNDSDIQYNATTSTTGLTINAGNKLYINAGKTFTASSTNVFINGNAGSGNDGSLHIASGATLITGATTSIAGNLTASSSATIQNYGVLAFTATSTGKTILATQSLGNLTFTGTGSYTFATSATTTNVTINAGATVVAPAVTLSILGNYTNNGTFTHNSGTTTLASTTKEQYLTGTLSGTSAFNTLNVVGNTTTTPSGLIGKWNLDEGAGTLAYDSSGNGNTGTLTSGPLWTTGKVGSGVDLDGADDYITVGSPALLDDVTQKTITAWINPVTTGDGTYGRIADKNAATANGWIFMVDGTNCTNCLRYYQYSSSGIGEWRTGNGTISFGANTWQHVAMTYDNSSATNDAILYINGAPSALSFDGNFAGSVLSDAANNLWFGDRSGNDRSFNGDMDDIRIYNRILTAGEIATIYNERPKFINANASTSNLFINSGVVALASSSLSIAGNYVNNGGFMAGSGTTTFNGTSAQTATGTMTGGSAFKNVEILNNTASTTFNAPFTATGHFKATAPNTYLAFPQNATSTLNTATIQGTSGNEVHLRSTSAGTRWGIEISGAYNISYVDVKDSSGSSTAGNIIATSSINSLNNNRWIFTGATMSSAANQTFYYTQPTTTISTITVTDNSGGTVNATNDIRIRIASTSVNMKWDTTDTTATFGGTASGKVTNPVSYEDNGTTLVVPVSNDFSEGDTLTIDGLSFSQFLGVNTATTSLKMYLAGASDILSDAVDNKTTVISGLSTLVNHTNGQVTDNINNTTEVGIPLFGFNLASAGENSTISSLTIRFTGVYGVTTSDLSNVALYRDNNSNGTYEAGDTAVGGTPVVTISDETGTIVFSTSFTASSTAKNYILVGSVDNMRVTEGFTLSLSATDVTIVGDTTGFMTLSSSLTNVQHMKGGGGAGSVGGAHGAIGGAPPAGDGIRGGGGSGGGSGGVDPDSGTPIGNEDGFNAPSGQGGGPPLHNAWTNGANVYTSDGVYMTTSGNGTQHSFTTFNFSVPMNNTVVGVEVKIEASGSTAAGTVSVGLSWNNGSNFTSLKTTGTMGLTDSVFLLGGPADTWDHSWSPSELANESFAIDITGNTSGNTLSIDAIQTKVYHQATGGGGGGGGAI